MKKACLFFSLLCLTGLYTAIKAQQKLPGFAEAIASTNAEKNHLKKLYDLELYDSAISYCAMARQKNSLGYQDLELALATAYYYKGDKNTAYQYVINHADYELKLNGGGGRPFGMLEDYNYAYPLATDTFLENIIIGKVTDYYLALDYFDPQTGLKLMFMDHERQKLAMKYLYDLQQYKIDNYKKDVEKEYRQQLRLSGEEFMKLIRENKKLFTLSQVGPAFEKQFLIIRNLDKLEDHVYLEPFFYQAMLSKEIIPDIYVDELITLKKLRNEDNTHLRVIEDSLCKIYKCNRLIMDSIQKKIAWFRKDSIGNTMKDSITYPPDTGK